MLANVVIFTNPGCAASVADTLGASPAAQRLRMDGGRRLHASWQMSDDESVEHLSAVIHELDPDIVAVYSSRRPTA